MKSRRSVIFAEEGKWTPGADSTLVVGDWQAWVNGEGHWRVRGPDPDDEAHYASGDVELTEAEFVEAGNSEARRRIRAQRAKKAARAYIQSMLRPSRVTHASTKKATRPQHAAKKRSATELNREIAASLAARGQPQLAAMFADPQARRTFAREMRHEIQKQQTTKSTAAHRTARPFVVKRLEQAGERRVPSVFGNYATEAEARSRADQLNGWVETHDGRVVYGVAQGRS